MHPRFDLRKIPEVTPVLESITDAFYAVGADWTFTYLNREAERLLNRPREALLGKNVWQEYPALLGTEFERLYLQVAQDKAPGTITAYYPDHARWYEVHAYPSEGGMSVYFRDATERVRAEEALRESELRFRVMADSIPQIVWIVDAQGHASFFNKQWYDYTGAPMSGNTPQSVAQQFVHPNDRLPTLKAWEDAFRTRSVFTVEHRIRSRSGEYRWFLVRAEPYLDPKSGEVLRWFGTSTDVHDRKLAEAELKKNEIRYRSLFESIDEGFCIIEVLFDEQDSPSDYRFVEVNPMFEQQTGLHHAQGKTAQELLPGLERHWYDIYGRIARTGEPARFESESKVMERWFDVYAFRIDEPSAHRVALLFKNITERRRFEQDMRQASRRKDEFLAMLAHELRNPLAPIGAAADLLRLAPFDEARVRLTSEVISRQVQHMTSLVDDLLDVSRVTRWLITLEFATLDVKRIVTSAVEQSLPLIEARRHHLSVHVPPEAAFVRADQKRLIQVISNLLNNAAKYTPEGGSIALRVAVTDAQVELCVSDNGIGMAPDLVNHVFELFEQGERTSDRSQGGLGIGLALVKSLVELHHGAVSAHSTGNGQGSEFSVMLPRVPAPEKIASEPLVRGSGAASQRLRILLVEDNQDAAQMLAQFLRAAGHEVLVEQDSGAAVERARQARPQVCLLDIGLPVMDGYELVRRLRAQQETRGAVMIAATGYGQDQDREKAAAAGFDHYFVKPIDTARLLEVLTRVPSG